VNGAADVVVTLRSRRTRRAILAQKLQHGVVGAALLSQGIATLAGRPAGIELGLGVIEVVTSVLLLGALARAFRQLRSAKPALHTHHGGIDWIDIFVAGVLAAEALERWHTHHRIPRPTILLILVTLTVGVAHGRIASFGDRRRALRLTPEGISIPKRPFGRFTRGWDQVRAITIGPREAVVEAVDGRRRIDLVDLENAPEVVAALEEAGRRHAELTAKRAQEAAALEEHAKHG
jgi:hypothetical protein